MHNVRLKDETYSKAVEIAKARGYESVEALFTELIEEETLVEEVNYDAFFTPGVLQEIDESLRDIESGQVYSLEEAREQLAKHRAEWLKNRNA